MQRSATRGPPDPEVIANVIRDVDGPTEVPEPVPKKTSRKRTGDDTLLLRGSQAQALYWELVSQEELGAAAAGGGGGAANGASGEGKNAKDDNGGNAGAAADSGGSADARCQVLDLQGDVMVFESTPRRTMLRRFDSLERRWTRQELPVVVHAAVPLPGEPRTVCILHCPSDWNSDHRYEVYACSADTGELEPLWVSSSKSEQLVDAGIAPKKRHAFSVAVHGRCIYFFCGLQHFPGDVTGSFVYCFSLDQRVWTEVEYSGIFPARCPERPYKGCRFGQSCVVHNGKAWVFGGCIHGSQEGVVMTNDLYTFDLEEHSWEKIDVQSGLRPPRMSGHDALVCCGRMLLFAGEGASQDIYAFDLVEQRWALLPPVMLGPRPADGRVVCCVSGDRLLAYQQYADEAPGSLRCWKHELFALSVGEVTVALSRCAGGRDAHKVARNRQELDLLGDEATADVAFIVDGRTMVAHRAILQRFCPALARLFESPRASHAGGSPGVGSGGGNRPQRRLGEEVRFNTFHLMLQHVYSRFTKPLTAADAESLLSLSGQLELSTLLQRCQEHVVVDASNVRTFLQLAAFSPGMEMLSQKCIAYLTSHPEHLSMVAGNPQKRLSLGGATGGNSGHTGPASITPEANSAILSPDLPVAQPRQQMHAATIAAVAAAALGAGETPGTAAAPTAAAISVAAAAAAAAAAVSSPRRADADALLRMGVTANRAVVGGPGGMLVVPPELAQQAGRASMQPSGRSSGVGMHPSFIASANRTVAANLSELHKMANTTAPHLHQHRHSNIIRATSPAPPTLPASAYSQQIAAAVPQLSTLAPAAHAVGPTAQHRHSAGLAQYPGHSSAASSWLAPHVLQATVNANPGKAPHYWQQQQQAPYFISTTTRTSH
eukprot:TRINITY_DN33051_c0_g1_i1.p1 TRINITY_DN33051_c0_g1~~TRINITY_DN33051_c0_g1_i1.p1  ORF type:complete len:887 (-),score=176.30 TRINITY_DN33051_c0_g1_i1:52-2712(-)